MGYQSKIRALAFAAVLCVFSAEGSSRCRLWLSLLSRPSVTATQVISSALAHRPFFEKARGGNSWLRYLESLSETDLKAPPEGNRWVPLEGELSATLQFMLRHVELYGNEAEVSSAQDKLRLSPVQRALLQELKTFFRDSLSRGRIQRSELLISTRVFSVASTYRLYLRDERPGNFRLYGNTPQEVWARARHGASEKAIDKRFGMTALPYPLATEVFPRDFLFAEPTSLILLGVSTRFQSVDAIRAMDPAYFLEHDKNHVEDRVDPQAQEKFPFALQVSHAYPLDRLLRAGMLDAIEFLTELTRKIDTLATPEGRRLAEAVSFYLFRELRLATPVVDFNAPTLRSLSEGLLKPAEINGLHARLRDQTDLGSILIEEPTVDELGEMVRWLSGQ